MFSDKYVVKNCEEGKITGSVQCQSKLVPLNTITQLVANLCKITIN